MKLTIAMTKLQSALGISLLACSLIFGLAPIAKADVNRPDVCSPNGPLRKIGEPPPRNALVPPFRVPPVPIVSGPMEGVFVEGNTGQFLFHGTNNQIVPATFTWQPGSGPILITSPRPLRLGHTNRYEICVFQTGTGGNDRSAQCNTRDRQLDGWAVFTAACAATSFTPNDGGLLQRANYPNGFKPIATANPQIFALGWKMRACNYYFCSAWTQAVGMTWLPPPPLDSVTMRNNGWPVAFKFGYVSGPPGSGLNFPGHRLCLSSPGVWCTLHSSSDPLVREGHFSQDTGSVQAVTIPDAYAAGVFAGQTSNWTAATCWDGPDGDPVCVYNANIRSVTLPP
jgi:hypothetical protein